MKELDPAVVAALLDQDRRLQEIEAVLGLPTAVLDRSRLLGLYDDALAGVAQEGLHAHWARAALTLDSAQLLILARLLRDPFPWQGLLRLLLAYQARGQAVDDAVTHVRGIAADLLHAQGLELITPEDVLHAQPVMEQAIRAIRKETNLTKGR